MKIQERKQLRIDLLQNSYDLYFKDDKDSNDSNVINKNELEKEKRLAYEYLEKKGFIEVETAGMGGIKCPITVYGIDFIESLEINK